MESFKLKCFLIGHSGKEKESGYHVCSCCGKHAYFDSLKYKSEHKDDKISTDLINSYYSNYHLMNSYEINSILILPFKILKNKISKLILTFKDFYKFKIKKTPPF